MTDVLVPTPFVPQETLFYCGPATLQMALTALGAAPPATPPTWQDQLWNDVMANTGATRPSGAPSTPTSPPFPTQKCEWCTAAGGWKCWSSTAGVLEYLLNAKQAKAIYSIDTFGNDRDATGAIMDALDLGFPGIALVYGWQHWLVVDGYQHGLPGSTMVAGRALNGVYIRDPLATSAIHLVPWSSWTSYLSSVPCGIYAESTVVFRAVAKPGSPPPQEPPPQAPTGVRIIDPLQVRRVRERFIMRAQTFIPKDDAIRRAAGAGSRLASPGRLQAAFAGAAADDAVLVQRLDAPDSYYYVVLFKSGGRETARMIVDAHSGETGEVMGIPEAGQTLPPYLTPSASLERLMADADRLADALRFRIRPGTVGSHPVLVWKPCGQSTSPFLPFYELSVGDSFVYYRVDGKRFDELTTGPA